MKKILISLALALTSVASVYAQSLNVFIFDNNGAFSNVRNAPNGKVVDRIPVDQAAMLDVGEPSNGWWMINDQSYYIPDGGLYHLSGSREYWIHHSCIPVGTRNYGAETLYLRKTPSRKGAVTYSFDEEIILRPVEIANGWVKVITLDGKHTGWIEEEWLCGNSVTNCS